MVVPGEEDGSHKCNVMASGLNSRKYGDHFAQAGPPLSLPDSTGNPYRGSQSITAGTRILHRGPWGCGDEAGHFIRADFR
jgi:hypothetical protein